MKATVSPIRQRLALKLDASIAFEALILNRLMRVPEARRKEWLRGLLVQGFTSECRALRELQRTAQPGVDEPGSNIVAAHQSVSAGRHQNSKRRSRTKSDLAADKALTISNTVSLAALRKVIG